VGAETRLPLELAHLHKRHYERAPGGVAVGAGERRDRVGLERAPRAYPRRWAQEAGGSDVAGRTQWSVKSLQCIQATSVQGTASVPQEATNMVTMMHYICTIFLSHRQRCVHEHICHVHLEDVVRYESLVARAKGHMRYIRPVHTPSTAPRRPAPPAPALHLASCIYLSSPQCVSKYTSIPASHPGEVPSKKPRRRGRAPTHARL